MTRLLHPTEVTKLVEDKISKEIKTAANASRRIGEFQNELEILRKQFQDLSQYTKSKIEQQSNEIKSLKDEIKSLKDEIKSLKDEIKSFKPNPFDIF